MTEEISQITALLEKTYEGRYIFTEMSKDSMSLFLAEAPFGPEYFSPTLIDAHSSYTHCGSQSLLGCDFVLVEYVCCAESPAFAMTVSHQGKTIAGWFVAKDWITNREV